MLSPAELEACAQHLARTLTPTRWAGAFNAIVEAYGEPEALAIEARATELETEAAEAYGCAA